MKTIKLINIPIEVIYPNNSQPRKYFDNQALLELSQSIQEYGILQPIIVSKEANRYIIIAGERRYRAAKLLKLTTLPCLVHQSSQIKVISIIENLQREDLSPMEEATAISEYFREQGLDVTISSNINDEPELPLKKPEKIKKQKKSRKKKDDKNEVL